MPLHNHYLEDIIILINNDLSRYTKPLWIQILKHPLCRILSKAIGTTMRLTKYIIAITERMFLL